MKKLLLSAALLASLAAHAQITGATWISTTNKNHTLLINQDSLRMNKPPWMAISLRFNPAVWMHYQQWTDQLFEWPNRQNLSVFIPAFNGHYTFTLLTPDTLLRHDTYNDRSYLYYRDTKKATK